MIVDLLLAVVGRVRLAQRWLRRARCARLGHDRDPFSARFACRRCGHEPGARRVTAPIYLTRVS